MNTVLCKVARYLAVFVFTVPIWTPSDAVAATRIFYASDWAGPMQIFAIDPTGRRPLAQITFDRIPTCADSSLPCGFVDPLPSPDGRKVIYRELGEPGALWLADATGRNARRIADATLDASFGPTGAVNPQAPYAVWAKDSKEVAYWGPGGMTHFLRLDRRRPSSGAWLRSWPQAGRAVSPDGRWLASLNSDGIVLTNRRTKRSRVLVRRRAFRVSWSPDSRALAYVEGAISVDLAATGDVHIVSLDGRDRVLVHGRGHVESIAWTKQPAGVAYRGEESVNGVYAGGRIGRLAADGSRVAYAACLNVFTWIPSSGAVRQLDEGPNRTAACVPPEQRDEIYDLAVAGDSVAWGQKTSGLTFSWSLLQAVDTTNVARYSLATGRDSLGSHFDGGGGLAGAGGTLLYSVWGTRPDPATTGGAVTAMTLFRAASAGCPCPAIAYAAAPAGGREVFVTPIVALDTDGKRIAALRFESLMLLDPFGIVLLSTSVQAAAAQFVEGGIVIALPHELRVYDTATGTLRRSWPLPSASVGRDCLFYSEPRCPTTAELKVQDAARGLAAYVLKGRVHIVRLSDGRDTVAAFGSEARFMDQGLVYADGARVRLIPYRSLR
ncbi:MAG TPA: hypothetical protein VFU26_12015 [Gaiellaceae bacterium]|nr:hypothetical protein [Gaiellaceae bacterium]